MTKTAKEVVRDMEGRVAARSFWDELEKIAKKTDKKALKGKRKIMKEGTYDDGDDIES